MQRARWMLVWALGCGATVEEGTDESSSSSSGEPSTSVTTTSPTTTATTTTATTGVTTSTTTSDDSTETTASTVDPDSSSGGESSTGDPAGICIGLDQYATVGEVFGRDGIEPMGMPCDTTPAPCGGDLVGEWTLFQYCGAEAIQDPFEEMCPGSDFMLVSQELEGTVTFVDDGTFMQAITTTSMYTVTLDATACFGVSCDQLETALAMNGDAACDGPDDACACMVTGMDATPVDGSYEIVDDTVVFMVDGLTGAPYPFCVAGDRLDLWPGVFDSTITDTMCTDVAECEGALGDAFDLYFCVDGGG